MIDAPKQSPPSQTPDRKPQHIRFPSPDPVQRAAQSVYAEGIAFMPKPKPVLPPPAAQQDAMPSDFDRIEKAEERRSEDVSACAATPTPMTHAFTFKQPETPLGSLRRTRPATDPSLVSKFLLYQSLTTLIERATSLRQELSRCIEQPLHTPHTPLDSLCALVVLAGDDVRARAAAHAGTLSRPSATAQGPKGLYGFDR